MDNIMEILEDIDDDCDVHGVHFVKISDPAAAYHFSISSLPTLVYFKNKMPNIYEGTQMFWSQIMNFIIWWNHDSGIIYFFLKVYQWELIESNNYFFQEFIFNDSMFNDNYILKYD